MPDRIAAWTRGKGDADGPLFFGIDVGGTNTKFGLVDDDGQIIVASKILTRPEHGPADAVVRMAAELERLVDETGATRQQVAAVGLATPGLMDIPKGMILEATNLRTWQHYAIRDALQLACGRPVAFVNDASAAAYAEYWVGSGRELPSLVLITLGTGIGAGIIVNGTSIDGEHSHGGECGHTIIDCHPEARKCSCGQRGHLEAYCSATSLVKITEERLTCDVPTSLRDQLAAGHELTTLLLAQEAEQGDELAMGVILDCARYLGIGIVNLVHTVDPAIVVLGGAMDFGGAQSKVGRRFLDQVRSEFRQRTFPVLAAKTRIGFAQLAGDAGFLGAAGMARSAYRTPGGSA